MATHRTTIRIDDDLYRRVKAEAARRGRRVSEVIEDAVRDAIRAPEPAESLPELPVFGGSGVQTGVDLTDVASLRERMDDGEQLDAMR
ncbi:MAG: ribbon-helix-helix domain-containing protein [Ilumatobacteraceae bacterium]